MYVKHKQHRTFILHSKMMPCVPEPCLTANKCDGNHRLMRRQRGGETVLYITNVEGKGLGGNLRLKGKEILF